MLLYIKFLSYIWQMLFQDPLDIQQILLEKKSGIA